MYVSAIYIPQPLGAPAPPVLGSPSGPENLRPYLKRHESLADSRDLWRSAESSKLDSETLEIYLVYGAPEI